MKILIIIIFVTAIIITGIIVILTDIFYEEPTWLILASILSAIFAIIGISVVVPSVWQQYFRAKSYYIAIVGFPKSGKTTLLASLFGEAFAGKIKPVKMQPRGTRTIETVNAYLEKLKKGEALGPTRSQDRIAFRADIAVGKNPFIRTYKAEFGDFPGSSTESYVKKYGKWLHKTEFFKWVAESDAMVFTIDLGHYLSRRKTRLDYINQMTTAMRAAWQHFLDVNEHRVKEVSKHPLVVVFNKADLFGAIEKLESENLIEKEIAKLGFGKATPTLKDINEESLKAGREMVKTDFAEIIEYFKQEAVNFQIIFCSSFGLIQDKRLGMNDLLWAVLPRQ